MGPMKASANNACGKKVRKPSHRETNCTTPSIACSRSRLSIWAHVYRSEHTSRGIAATKPVYSASNLQGDCGDTSKKDDSVRGLAGSRPGDRGVQQDDARSE